MHVLTVKTTFLAAVGTFAGHSQKKFHSTQTFA